MVLFSSCKILKNHSRYGLSQWETTNTWYRRLSFAEPIPKMIHLQRKQTGSSLMTFRAIEYLDSARVSFIYIFTFIQQANQMSYIQQVRMVWWFDHAWTQTAERVCALPSNWMESPFWCQRSASLLVEIYVNINFRALIILKRPLAKLVWNGNLDTATAHSWMWSTQMQHIAFVVFGEISSPEKEGRHGQH